MKKLKIIYNHRLDSIFLSLLSIFLLTLAILISINLVILSETPVEMKRNIQIINPKPDFSMSLRLDKGIGATYVPGERVRIYFRTDKISYVTLFRYDANGNVRLLFPNQNQKTSLVEPNRNYFVDYNIERGVPASFEYIQGFATLEPVLITREIEKRLEAEFMPSLGEEIPNFIQRIRNILLGLPISRWVSSEILHYQVMERRLGTGQLYVTSQPEDANVFLNDRYAGQTPLIVENLRIGEYIVRVELSGYELWERQVQINDNRTTFLSAYLQGTGQYGSIAVRCNENIARIYLDGNFKRLTQANRDIVLEEVAAGFHDLRITLSGYYDWSQRVEVKPNQRVQLTVNLEKITRTGSLEISCNVNDAMIYLDGNYLGRTSSNKDIIIANIIEGSYELRVAKDGYYDHTSTVRIYADRITGVDVQLEGEQRAIPKGAIAIFCNEDGARIFVNGVYKTTTSALRAEIVGELEEKAYEITVIKEGYRIDRKSVV